MSLLPLPLLGAAPDAPFPDPATALREPDGLLAFGGDLHPDRLLAAYRNGIFPWFSEGQPPLWWSPDPRCVLDPAALHLSRRTRRELRRQRWTVAADTDFAAVIARCAGVPRAGQRGTWITDEMQLAYLALHRLGHAHSVEVRDGDRLVGGIYGVSIGRAFFGESMFSLAPGASKLAIAALAARLADWDYRLLDGQVESPHLRTLGFQTLARPDFLVLCRQACDLPPPENRWTSAFAALDMAAVIDRPSPASR